MSQAKQAQLQRPHFPKPRGSFRRYCTSRPLVHHKSSRERSFHQRTDSSPIRFDVHTALEPKRVSALSSFLRMDSPTPVAGRVLGPLKGAMAYSVQLSATLFANSPAANRVGDWLPGNLIA